VGVTLHILHTGIVVAGVGFVLFLIWPVRSPTLRRVDELRQSVRDGRVVEDAFGRARRAQEGTGAPAAGRAIHREPLRVAIAVSTVIAASVHAAVGPEHFREGVRFGVFFVLLSAAQFVLASAVLMRRSRRLLAVLAALSAVVIVLWIATRTTALPFGLDDREPVGVLDLMSSVAEAVALAAAVVMLRSPVARRHHGFDRAALAVVSEGH